MTEPYRTIDLSPTERFAQYLDDYDADLDQFVGDSLCVVSPDIRDQNLWGEANKQRAEVFHSLLRRFEWRVGGDDLAERVFVKWLALQGVPAKRVTLTAYREQTNAVVWSSDEPSLSDEVWSYLLQGVKAWYSGDYSTVKHETLVTYTAESGATIERWETLEEDGIVTAYTDQFDLATVREFFPYTETADR